MKRLELSVDLASPAKKYCYRPLSPLNSYLKFSAKQIIMSFFAEIKKQYGICSETAEDAATWQPRHVTIRALSTDHKGQLAITTRQPSTIWFDQISAKPVKTFRVSSSFVSLAYRTYRPFSSYSVREMLSPCINFLLVEGILAFFLCRCSLRAFVARPFDSDTLVSHCFLDVDLRAYPSRMSSGRFSLFEQVDIVEFQSCGFRVFITFGLLISASPGLEGLQQRLDPFPVSNVPSSISALFPHASWLV